MGDITKNISQHELNCKCDDPECQVTILPYEPVIQIVQDYCTYVETILSVDKVTCRIHSGARCFVYNLICGSNDSSQHPRCRAIDFSIDGIDSWRVYRYLHARYPNKYGIGHYSSFTHIDDRNIKARWEG